MSSKKSTPIRYIRHDIDVIKAALEDIQSKGMSLREAAKFHNLPVTTLHNKLKGKNPLLSKKTLLTVDEENKLAKWLIELAKYGFGKSNNEVLETVRAIIAARKDSTQSQEQIKLPTRQWLFRFFGRHPELSSRAPMSLGKERALVSPEAVSLWFTKFEKAINSVDPTILISPNRIFNADESGFGFDKKNRKVVAFKGSKHIYKM
ncbi:uncharacterized protein LOC129925957 [Biomphalaria glabrata]|uniref:Uncharacterized protein LOC129925957 n=1 Tax=Biomphalaria glabrata TaxID=6526 RepID=A0A9W3A8F6_BIOGL|nr:uncharacterized protein LOC129925957 [Biomphalaria glabrata]